MKMDGRSGISRRQWLGQMAAAGIGGPFIISSTLRASPSERINLGFIGVGTMGRGHLGKFLRQNDVQVVAVCDVVAERRDDARKTVEDFYGKSAGKRSHYGCGAYNDFRDLLDRKDVDAVVIATPDHWHTIPCIMAANLKKDVYCEKPLTHSIAEGRKLVDAVQRNRIIFQTGSQQRSEFGGRFRRAVEMVRDHRIGKVKTVRIGVGPSPKPCDLPEEPIPPGTDWDLWLGPAAMRPYNSVLCPKGVHKHFPAWRSYREYGGGGLADMGAHHFDIAQWALHMDCSGPTRLEPPTTGDSGLKFTYANGIEMVHGGPTDCVFEGTEGTILVSRGKLETKPEEIVKQPAPPGGYKTYPSNDHARNWLDCIRNGKQPICTAEIGHRSATVCHLANIGYELRRPLTWDPAKERFVDDEGANQLLDRPRREPWRV